MLLRRSVLPSLLAGMILAGCHAAPKPAPQPQPVAATPQQISQYQQQFLQYDKNARVGAVAGVRPQNNLLAVTGIPLSDIKVGDAVTITDSAQKPLANGTVQQISTAHGNFVIVKYTSDSGARVPQTGDVAIHFMLNK
jgi:predicted metalloprotease with PDZ domain